MEDTTEATLRRLDADEVAAFLAADIGRLAEIHHPDYVVNAPHNRIMEGAVTLGALASGRLRHVRLERAVETVRVFGDVAVLMGREWVQDDTGPMAGPPFERRFTGVWQRTGEGWRTIARHASLVAPPPPRAGA